MKRPIRTSNQKEIMGVILREAGNGRFLTSAEVYAMVNYAGTVTYGAIRKTIETLERGGMVARERQGRRFIIIPTLRGYDWFRPAR